MKMKYLAAVAVALTPVSAFAQMEAPAPVAAPAVMSAAPVEAPQLMLPANTEVAVTPTSDLTSKGIKEGHVVPLTTVFDVMLNGYVVIPKGTPGQGTVVWRTGKGAFGKSAKMDVRFDHLEISGRKVGLVGTHRQSGDGNTGATVGAIVGAGLIGGVLVTGKSAKIPHGMQLSARTAEALPVIIPAGAVPIPNATVGPAAEPAAASAPTVPTTN
ncbi:MAG: hypothetical protein ACKVOP_01610 [Sphingomonadaceae bacterium]